MTIRVHISCTLFDDILHGGVNNQWFDSLETLLTADIDSNVAMLNTLSKHINYICIQMIPFAKCH